jgi:hypothetical protein
MCAGLDFVSPSTIGASMCVVTMGACVDCWTCEKTALGACRFCGRGACREHAQVRPFIVGLYRGKPDELVKAVVVEDALHCGVCHPRGEPVPLPELE